MLRISAQTPFDSVNFNPRRSNLTIWLKLLVGIGVLLLVERFVYYFRAYSAPPEYSKAIVAASTIADDTSWIAKNLGRRWDVNVYVVDNVTADLTVYKNTGREASVYLTYIINHYWSLPDLVLFSHGTRYQWHNDDPMFDGAASINNLQLDYVRREGYVNLRCDWHSTCPVAVAPNTTELPAASSDYEKADFEGLFAVAYRELFPDHKKVPETVGHQCCAQFAVTKDQIHRKPPAYYEHIRQWIWTNQMDPFHAGRTIEHVWHIIFGKNAVQCQNAAECYCKVYGLCDLKCPDAPKNCLGRFWITPFWVSTNKKWPEEGQGENGYPVDKWWEEFYPTDVYDGFRLRPNATLPADAYRATAVLENQKAVNPAKAEKPEEPAEPAQSPKVEKPAGLEKVEKPADPAKTAKPWRPVIVEKPGELPKLGRPAGPAKVEKLGEAAKAEQHARPARIGTRSLAHGLRRPVERP